MQTQTQVGEIAILPHSIKFNVLVVKEPRPTDGPDFFLSIVLEKNNMSVDLLREELKLDAKTFLRFEPVSLCESSSLPALPDTATDADRHRRRAKSWLYGSIHPDYISNAIEELKLGADLGDDDCLNLLHVVCALHGSIIPDPKSFPPMTRSAFEKPECATWAGEGQLYEALRDLLLNMHKTHKWVTVLVHAASKGNLLAWSILRSAGQLDDSMSRLYRLHERFPRDATV